jgi:hypothetical protein
MRNGVLNVRGTCYLPYSISEVFFITVTVYYMSLYRSSLWRKGGSDSKHFSGYKIVELLRVK